MLFYNFLLEVSKTEQKSWENVKFATLVVFCLNCAYICTYHYLISKKVATDFSDDLVTEVFGCKESTVAV